MKSSLSLVFALSLSLSCLAGEPIVLSSPDQHLTVKLTLDDSITISLFQGSARLLRPSAIGMVVGPGQGQTWGLKPVLKSRKTFSEDHMMPSPFYTKSEVNEKYSGVILDFKQNYGLEVRVYNEGAAYRFFSKKSGKYTVLSETVSLGLEPEDRLVGSLVKGNRDDHFINSFENTYTMTSPDSLDSRALVMLPLLVRKKDGLSMVISESNLRSYPGWYIQKGAGPARLQALFAPRPLAESPSEDVQEIHVKGRSNYIASVNADSRGRTFPWRLFAVASQEKDLLANDLAYLLAEPSKIADLSWIKPGKASWDWWSDWNLRGVNFRSGVNDSTYRFHIDFASKNKLEYIVMDAGWYDGFDALHTVKDIHLPELVTYAGQKQVGVWLWIGSSRLLGREDEIFGHYARMGIKGFKIDFFDRDDQLTVDFVYKLLEVAARWHLMLDLHGMFKPCGMQREYPNLMGVEGVFGLENYKWSTYPEIPALTCTLPFTRMFAGMMDYTPGAMRNETRANYHPSNTLPESQGTRCQQLAMYTLYYAPLQMLADNPADYIKEQVCTDFISRIPSVWDKTVPLAGEAASFVAVARKKGSRWYVGAMCNWQPRTLSVDCSFLDKGEYQLELFEDGPNAAHRADDYLKKEIRVNSQSHLNLNLAPGGGWAGIFSPVKSAVSH